MSSRVAECFAPHVDKASGVGSEMNRGGGLEDAREGWQYGVCWADIEG